jgi:hypothetical protein
VTVTFHSPSIRSLAILLSKTDFVVLMFFMTVVKQLVMTGKVALKLVATARLIEPFVKTRVTDRILVAVGVSVNK